MKVRCHVHISVLGERDTSDVCVHNRLIGWLGNWQVPVTFVDKKGQIGWIWAVWSVLSVCVGLIGEERWMSPLSLFPDSCVFGAAGVLTVRDWWKVVQVWNVDTGRARVQGTDPICELHSPECISDAQGEGSGDQKPCGVCEQCVWVLWRERARAGLLASALTVGLFCGYCCLSALLLYCYQVYWYVYSIVQYSFLIICIFD